MQDIAHYTPIQAGLALLPMAMLSVIVAQFVPARIATRFGVQIASALGMFLGIRESPAKVANEEASSTYEAI